MTTKIRQAVFETNSSSSHSLTLGTTRLMAPPFPKSVLRKGVVTIELGEYGWEYHRFYKTENKLSYLLTQLAHDAEGGSDGTATMEAMRKRDSRVEQLCRVVKEHTGCVIQLGDTSGSIDHQSVGYALEVFETDDTLRQFLFAQDSCIETGNDNLPAPWWMPTDRGMELTYAPFVNDVPQDYVSIELLAPNGRDLAAWQSPEGALLDDKRHTELRNQVVEQGVVQSAHVRTRGPYAYYDRHNPARDALALQLSAPANGAPMRLARAFDVSCDHRLDDGSCTVDVTLTVMVPPALAKKLADARPSATASAKAVPEEAK